ncbi:MAG: recombinase family protein [Oscillospiraceae bacterium]|nr:recombinase family protein [Oscillospiraceae bacterium]MDY6207909.1 recombinase family protein [Oscillospiraceae bacterium]
MSQRIRLSKEASAERNEETGGVAPYGYCIRNKKLEVNYDESPAVKLIFDRYIAGFTYSQIIAELKEKGFKPRTGETFNKSTIHDNIIYVENKE